MRSPCCVCVCMCTPLIVAKQQMGKHVPAATNTHATVEELLDPSFSLRSVSYEKKVGCYFFQDLLVFYC
jgi:hypothetical protein